MTWVLGLTGGIGSGKTAASDYFTSLGIDVVDADIVAREIVEPEQPAWQAIVERFGGAKQVGCQKIISGFAGRCRRPSPRGAFRGAKSEFCSTAC